MGQLKSGNDAGGQLVYELDDSSIVPVRIGVDSAGNLVPVPSGPGATEAKQDDIIDELLVRTNIEGGGKVAVGEAAQVEITFTGNTKAILISADPSNTGTIYIGKTGVTNVGVNALTYLEAGENITISYDDSTNALYAIASIAAQNIWKGAVL